MPVQTSRGLFCPRHGALGGGARLAVRLPGGGSAAVRAAFCPACGAYYTAVRKSSTSGGRPPARPSWRAPGFSPAHG